eukprot:6071791-Amphidinium_carterae.1
MKSTELHRSLLSCGRRCVAQPLSDVSATAHLQINKTPNAFTPSAFTSHALYHGKEFDDLPDKTHISADAVKCIAIRKKINSYCRKGLGTGWV